MIVMLQDGTYTITSSLMLSSFLLHCQFWRSPKCHSIAKHGRQVKLISELEARGWRLETGDTLKKS
jgi:hypothetical protein